MIGAPTLTMGRSGYEFADEEEYDAWVRFVCDRIDERAGFEVIVDTRGVRDIQRDSIAGTDEHVCVLTEVLYDLWLEWCSEPSEVRP